MRNGECGKRSAERGVRTGERKGEGGTEYGTRCGTEFDMTFRKRVGRCSTGVGAIGGGNIIVVQEEAFFYLSPGLAMATLRIGNVAAPKTLSHVCLR